MELNSGLLVRFPRIEGIDIFDSWYESYGIITIYKQRSDAKTNYQKRNALRDAAIAELLFATGMRISELCTLKSDDVNLFDGTILIYGKGDKERRIQIGNDDVIRICIFRLT